VSGPTEDICSYCYQFQNKFRYRVHTCTSSSSKEDGEEDGRGDDERSAADIVSHHPPPLYVPITEDVEFSSDDEKEEPPAVVEEKEEEVDDDILDREKQIEDAVKHVKMARAQRQLVNDKMDKAKEDALTNTIHTERTHTFIVDYGQNMSLPSFGTSQPGDTYYYYTSLTIFNLGVVAGCLSSRRRASLLSSLQGR
jgi:hypothetical protein